MPLEMVKGKGMEHNNFFQGNLSLAVLFRYTTLLKKNLTFGTKHRSFVSFSQSCTFCSKSRADYYSKMFEVILIF